MNSTLNQMSLRTHIAYHHHLKSSLLWPQDNKCDSEWCTQCRVIALWTSPVLTLSGVACVSRKKQATDAAPCGPGAGGRPHDWMDSCAVFISQKGLLLSASFVAIWSCTASYCICIKRNSVVCNLHSAHITETPARRCTYIAGNLFMKNTVRLSLLSRLVVL